MITNYSISIPSECKDPLRLGYEQLTNALQLCQSNQKFEDFIMWYDKHKVEYEYWPELRTCWPEVENKYEL